MLTADGLSYLTVEEPGIGGHIKRRPEDFVVEELPLFEPEGRGDHLYLFIEKRRRLTTDVVRYLSRHFSVPWNSIGYAGLKDKHAVTRQWFSIEHVSEERARQFQDSHVQILDMSRHPTKLKRGNLAGNRFSIHIRDVSVSDAPRARRILERLVAQGAPNFLGEQRFGYRNNNHLLGRALILGDVQHFLDLMLGGPDPSEPPLVREARQAYDLADYRKSLELWPTVHRFERQAIGPLSRGAPPRDVLNAIDKPHLHLLVSAFQSAIFNEVLNDRLKAGRFTRLMKGDLAFLHATRGVCEVADPEVEQPRCDRLEISPTGPMWGRKMTRASGEVGDLEERSLQATGVSERDFEVGEFTPDGSRRAMRMLVHNPDISGGADEHGPYIHISFELGRGSFATIVLREIMKNDPAEEGTAGS
jgi:tRNA pseudouridine13 synthase